jgi:hypothetical protein
VEHFFAQGARVAFLDLDQKGGDGRFVDCGGRMEDGAAHRSAP